MDCLTLNPKWLSDVALYHVYLHLNERETLSQAIVTQNALLRAGYNDTANRLALNYIVPVMTRKGYYVALLKEWLPKICFR